MTKTAQAKPASAIADPHTDAPQPPKLAAIATKDGRLAQYQRNCWTVIAPDSVSAEQLEDPRLYTLVCQKYQVFDRVEVLQSRRWSELIVFDVRPGVARLKLLQTIELPAREMGMETGLPEGHSIRLGGPGASPYEVFRGEQLLSQYVRLNTFEEARKWLLGLSCFTGRGF